MPFRFSSESLHISGGVFKNVGRDNIVHYNQYSMRNGLHHLARAIPRGATYDSPERYLRTGCYPGTREAINSDIVRWVKGEDEQTKFLWIHGPAGAGKSAIAQSVAELLGDKGPEAAPLATFFFSRDNAQRNCGDCIFSTIAYQLAVSIPETREEIENAIDQNPNIITSSMQTQFESLLLAPLKHLATEFPGHLFPIIVDGLDECLDERVQDQILCLLQSLIRNLLPVRIIVTSRPEPHIRNMISDLFPDDSLLRILELKHTEAVDQEIRLYLRGGFKNIYTDKNHRHIMRNIQKPWPSDDEIERLIEKASGQFIYASTVIKYVGDRYSRPPDQLRHILGVPHAPTEALADLDSLYCQILTNNPHRDRMLDVLGFMVVILRTEGASSTFPILLVVEQLLGLKLGETYLALRNLYSLIDLPEPDSFTNCPPYSHNPTFFHASFSDFLTDKGRAGDFFIDDHEYHLRMKDACIMAIMKLPRPGHTHDGHSCSYAGWMYAVARWLSHWRVRIDGKPGFQHPWMIAEEYKATSPSHVFIEKWLEIIFSRKDACGLDLDECSMYGVIKAPDTVYPFVHVLRYSPKGFLYKDSSVEMLWDYSYVFNKMLTDRVAASPYPDALKSIIGFLIGTGQVDGVKVEFLHNLHYVKKCRLRALLEPFQPFLHDPEQGLITKPECFALSPFSNDPTFANTYRMDDKAATDWLVILLRRIDEICFDDYCALYMRCLTQLFLRALPSSEALDLLELATDSIISIFHPGSDSGLPEPKYVAEPLLKWVKVSH